MPGPESWTLITRSCGARSPSTPNSILPPGGIAERVAGDFRHRGGDARLVLRLEADQCGNLARALPGADHILLVADRDREQADRHAGGEPSARKATTVTSSRPRR
jgi:hypothetical protein